MSLRPLLPAIGIVMLGLAPGGPRARADEPPPKAFEENVAPSWPSTATTATAGPGRRAGSTSRAIRQGRRGQGPGGLGAVVERRGGRDAARGQAAARARGGRAAVGWIESRLSKADCNGRATRAGSPPPAQPGRVQQHDPRPGRRRLPAGRRLPLRRRRLRLRQHRRRAVAAAAPDGEVPGRRRDDRRAGDRRRPTSPGPVEDAARPTTCATGGGRPSRRDGRRILRTDGEIAVDARLPARRRVHHPRSGPSASRPAHEPARMAVRLDGKTLEDVRRRRPSRGRPAGLRGPRPSSRRARTGSRVAFLNDFYDPKAPTRAARPQPASSTSLEIAGPDRRRRRRRCPSRTGGSSSRTPTPATTTTSAPARSSSGSPRRAYRRPVDRRARSTGCVKLVDLAEQEGDRFERRHPARRRGGARLAALPVPRRARPAGEPQAGRRRYPINEYELASPAVVLPLEQHARRRAVRAGRARASCASRTTSSAQVRRMLARPEGAGAGRELRRPVAAAPQPRRRQPRPEAVSRRSTSRCARRWPARPSCSSRRSCARTAASSTSSTPTTPSSTSGWRSTTASPGVKGDEFRRVTLAGRPARRRARRRRAS